ncbi:MAG: hypothetical protein R3C03_06410 [Pirellulaceae bacterium]
MSANSKKPESSDLENHSTKESLIWLAFCYLADEQSPVERADFEQRLETDAAAQEALVEAARLSYVVAAVSRESQSQPVVISAEDSNASPRIAARGNTPFLIALAMTVLALVIAGFYLTRYMPTNESLVAQNKDERHIMNESFATNVDGPNDIELEQNIASAWADQFGELLQPLDEWFSSDSLTSSLVSVPFFDDEPTTEISTLSNDESDEDWLIAAVLSLENTDDVSDPQLFLTN